MLRVHATTRLLGAGTLLLATLVVLPGAGAATLPPGFSESLVASGLSNPTAMQFAPDGRLFVCQQGGALRVIKNGVLLGTPFVTLPVNADGERGLLGVAFDPNFVANQYVYVYYTTSSAPVHNRISRLTANDDVAAAGSEVVLMDLENLGATNHNGGAMNFGPDGKLYVAVGENAISSNAQTLSNRLGKMLRLNTDGGIPTDNPFYNTAVGNNRAIWALGLRNPFTFAFNPGGPAPTMLINDVGQSAWEEVNDGIAGANYGWPDEEGPESPPNPAFTDPRYAYPNDASTCAITGGAFYGPANVVFPGEYLNDYFFADNCAGWIRRLDTATNTVTGFATGVNGPVDLKVGADGFLYYLARGASSIYRVAYGNLPPGITTHPANRTVSPGQAATFTVVASGTPPFTYQWQRFQGANWVNVGTNSASYTVSNLQAPADNGARFRVNVANAAGNLFSNEAVLTVTTNQAPVATITLPSAGQLYAGGQTIAFAGTGTDAEDGPQSLPASAFTWRVDFHHDTHSHPFLPATSGLTAGTFVIPTSGETAANVWYRVFLTVSDSAGRTHTVQRDIFPRVVRVTLATSPAGLQLRLDGQPVATPHAFDSVVGVVRAIDAADQSVGGISYAFSAWSDGGARGRSISTPPVATTYTAHFVTVAAAGPPATPTGVAMLANGRSVQVSWNRAAGAMAYRLEAGTGPGLANLFNGDVGDVDRVQAVVPPGPYFVRVRAANLSGVSPASAEVSVTVSGTATCVVPPPAPTGYTAQTGGLLVALSWAVSPSATGYILEAGSGPGLANLVNSGVGNVTTFTATAPAGTYYTRVRAMNDCGVSASASVELPVTLGCSAEAVVPGGLTVTKSGGAAFFSWLPPLGATGYRIRAGTAPGISNLADVDVGASTAVAVNLAGVPPGLYYVRVAAVSACGIGAPSNEVAINVP